MKLVGKIRNRGARGKEIQTAEYVPDGPIILAPREVDTRKRVDSSRAEQPRVDESFIRPSYVVPEK